jgi:protease IV
MTDRSFRQRHPVLLGFLILGAIFFLFWGGMAYFISTIIKPRTELFGAKEAIGVIEVKGLITSSEETIRWLTEFRNNKSIKAIIIRIDSPGGAVGASQEIYREVQQTNLVKPVVASMGSVAASGGFYAAIGAGKIVANPGTLTGSIGVIVKIANLKELFDKIGYQSEVVKSGRLKDIGSPERMLLPEEREMLQEVIDTLHRQFIGDIVQGRGLPEQLVMELADGRIFSGAQAQELGLVDQLGNFTDAVKLASEAGGLKTEVPRLVYPVERDFSILRFLTGGEQIELLNRLLQPAPVLSYEWLLTVRGAGQSITD